MADHSTEIASLEAIINSAQTSASVDGLSHTIDLTQARKRLAELRADDDASMLAGRVRPKILGMKLGGAW